MTIENMDKYLESQWDWSVLDGCFGETRIKPTDIDGLVERNGQFLLIEAKLPGAKLKMGQRLTLEALHKTGIFTIACIWGKCPEVDQMVVHDPGDTMWRPVYEADTQVFALVVSRWFEWADGPGRAMPHAEYGYI